MIRIKSTTILSLKNMFLFEHKPSSVVRIISCFLRNNFKSTLIKHLMIYRSNGQIQIALTTTFLNREEDMKRLIDHVMVANLRCYEKDIGLPRN